jgi:hypothetical protein
MPTPCFDPSERPAPPDLATHLEECPACRAQWKAHRELVELLGTSEPPRLALEFNARLLRRLESQSHAVPASPRWPRWPRTLLRLYWAAAALASLAIVARLDWEPWLASLGPVERVWAALALLATPMIALFDLAWLRRLYAAFPLRVAG